MGEMSFPPGLQQWIDLRVAEGRYADAADYLRDLVRRDQEHGPAPAEDTEWLRRQVQKGIDSGISDEDPFELIDRLLAEHSAIHD